MSGELREKVINALRRCESYGYCDDKKCPYYENTGCLESLRKDAMELLKAQESGWININVRMPEFEGDYYVTDGHKEPWKCRMMKFCGVKGWINSANNPAIKYWLQMPEPPKEG